MIQDDVDQRNPKTHENGGKSQNLGQNKVGVTENVVKSTTCFVCDGKDNWVLVCYGEECPIAVHQSCASDEPDFDEFGNFYCPYCWYKRVVVKCVELGKKLMVSDKSRIGCRDTLGGVDLGLKMDKETENIENLVGVNVSGGRTLASGNSSGKRREGDGSNNKCMVMGKNRKMKEVGAQTHSRANSKGGDADVDEGRQQQGRLSEKNHEMSDACISNAGEGRKGRERGSEKNHEMVQVHSSDVGEERDHHSRCDDINHEMAQAQSIDVGVKTRKQRRYSENNQQNKRIAGTHGQEVYTNNEGTHAHNSDLGEGRSGQGCCHENNLQEKPARGSEKIHEKVQVCNSDVDRERKPQKRCDDINHETAQAHSFVVGIKTREKRRYSEKNQQHKTVSGTHEQDVFMTDEGTQARDSDLVEGRSGLGYCHENNQQKKLSSTERCEQKVLRTDERVSHGSGLGEGRYREGRHIEKNQRAETTETENLGKEVFKERKRKRERGMERDGDEFYLAENQYRQCQPDMRNDDVAFNKQETGFSKDERVEQKSVSSISSPESTNNVNESNVASQELALIIHPKAGVQERPIEARPLCSVSSKKPSFQPEKYGHKSYLEKNGTVSNDPGQRFLFIWNFVAFKLSLA